MKSRMRLTRKPLSRHIHSLPAYLLILLVFSVGSYAIIDKFAALDDNLGLLISFKPSPLGLSVAGVSIGYATSGLVVLLAALTMISRRANNFRISKAKVFAVLVLGLILGAGFAVSQTVAVPPSFPNHISDSSDGFTLNVYYGPTSFRAGNNISLEYELKNNAYTTTLFYLYFGGQFSMVFYNAIGQQIIAFHVPISFELSAGQTSIEFVPGETWSTLLSWNGSINETSSLAPSGNYTLASYAVLQDANASLYDVLHTSNLTINFLN